MQIFNEIDKVIKEVDEFQSNKTIIDEQKNLEKQRLITSSKLKHINNPECMTTGTEDLSSGASNRSKTTMGTDSDYHQLTNPGTTPDKIKITLDYESKKRGRKEKIDSKTNTQSSKGCMKQQTLSTNADIIEIRDSSSKHEDLTKLGKRTSRASVGS